MRSTMRGAGVHLALGGAAGMLIGQSCFSGTSIANAIDLPSGDQCSSEGVLVTRVTWVVAPVASIQRTNTWVPLGSPSAR